MTSAEVDRSGKRLEALREMFGLTQTGLAERLGVNQSFLSRVEKDERPLPADLITKMVLAYRVPPAFFEVHSPEQDAFVQTFWKTSKATVAEERRIKRLHREASRVFASVSVGSGYRSAAFVDPLDHGADVEHVAILMRERLQLGPDAPVLNVTRELERLGIGVITNLDHMDPERTDHKGISMPHASSRPLVALVADMNGAERRHALMHELGHLIFDQGLTVPIRTQRNPAELRAHHFARAMLLPVAAISESVSESLNLQGYLRLKARFGAPVASIFKRGRELGLLSSDRERSLFIQWSSQGWRKNEPVDVAVEKPILLGQAMTQVYGRDRWAASQDLGLPLALLRQWVHEESDTTTPSSGSDAPVIDLASRRVHDS